MEFDTVDALDDLEDSVSSMKVKDNEKRRNLLTEDKFACLRYFGGMKTDEEITRAIELGTKSLEFTQLVEWLSKELQAINKMESCVNALTDVEDASSFLLEVSSFLRELHCPYKSLINGPISQRLLDVESRRIFLDYLCTELLAARLLYSKSEVRNNMEILMDASSTALSLQNALEALNIKIDTDNCKESEVYLLEMENKIREILNSKSMDVSPAILSERLSDQQWESLCALYEDFFDEYTVRRKLLLTRLEVTVQSFKWGEGSKGKETKIINAYLPQRKHLKDEPSIKLSDVIAARESLLVVEKTSCANVVKNTKSSVNRVLIPAMPDRGGRPKEHRTPVEMPNWKKRSQDGGRGGGHQCGSGNRKGKNKKRHGGRGKGGGNFDTAGSD